MFSVLDDSPLGYITHIIYIYIGMNVYREIDKWTESK